MSNFLEIDFLAVETKKSGDAITIRYKINNKTTIHVVDGGYASTGEQVISHIQEYYGHNAVIDRMIVTHPDHDHARGLREVLEKMEVRELWMLRPWLYSDELVDRFKRWSNPDNLTERLKEIYPNIAALEEIAEKKGIKICEPFQGKRIGQFLVLAPSEERYLDLIAESEKTPEVSTESTKFEQVKDSIYESFKSVVNFIKAKWGEENLPRKETSAENNMSVVQYAVFDGKGVLLTGDAGVETLDEALDYLEKRCGGKLPKIDRFQVPHHGSRRNISSDVLDRLFGKVRSENSNSTTFSAFISSAKEDKDHPRKSVVRALHHRGGKVLATEGKCIRTVIGNAPKREGWSTATPMPYPEEQEE